MKKELLFTWLLLFAVSFITNCGKKTSDSQNHIIENFLPEQGDIEGWDRGTGTGDYMEANDYSTLYDIINEPASVFITHGFIEGVQQIYYGVIQEFEVNLRLFIADMGDSTGAFNLFHDSLMTPPSSTPVEYGDEGRLNEELLSVDIIDFRLEKYYVSLTIMREGSKAEVLQVLDQFATAVETNMGG